MYCSINKQPAVDISLPPYRNCSKELSTCGGWKYYYAKCSRKNPLCKPNSGAWVAATTVCSQKLFYN